MCLRCMHTINKPGGEPGGISGRIDKISCKTHYLNLPPQSWRIFTCRCTSLVAGHRPNAYPPNHYTAVATNRRQGCRSQTQCLFLLQTDSRVVGARPNAYPPTTTWQWLLADARVGSVPDWTLITPILADARVGSVPDQTLITPILADARVGSVPDRM